MDGYGSYYDDYDDPDDYDADFDIDIDTAGYPEIEATIDDALCGREDD